MNSAEEALQFLHAGATVVQMCSTVHNKDFTVVLLEGAVHALCSGGGLLMP